MHGGRRNSSISAGSLCIDATVGMARLRLARRRRRAAVATVDAANIGISAGLRRTLDHIGAGRDLDRVRLAGLRRRKDRAAPAAPRHIAPALRRAARDGGEQRAKSEERIMVVISAAAPSAAPAAVEVAEAAARALDDEGGRRRPGAGESLGRIDRPRRAPSDPRRGRSGCSPVAG